MLLYRMPQIGNIKSVKRRETVFDQNISFRAVKSVQNIFPGAVQVRELKLENSSDKAIWDFLRKNAYSIVTFDSDFSSLATLYGHPPKIIWLRTGNISTDSLIQFFESHSEIIKEFLTSADYVKIACLELE
jgi:predicted nuclease of predicted toxin-antitoxin system